MLSKTPMKLTLLFLILVVTSVNAQRGASVDHNGQFYATVEDYLNNKSVPGIYITNNSVRYGGSFGQTTLTTVDNSANPTKTNIKNLPGEVFTYYVTTDRRFLDRVIDEKLYIILAMGKINFYALLEDNMKLFTSEGWNGKLVRYSQNGFEKTLAEHDLLEACKATEPRKERGDSMNTYFSKYVAWQITCFDLLNENL